MKENIIVTNPRLRIPYCYECKKKFPKAKVICECGREMKFEESMKEEWIRNDLNTRIVQGVRKMMQKNKSEIVVGGKEDKMTALSRAHYEWGFFKGLNISDIKNERIVIPKIKCYDCGICNNCKKYFTKFIVKDRREVCPECGSGDIIHTREKMNLDDDMEEIELIKSLIYENRIISQKDKNKMERILEPLKIICQKCKSLNVSAMKSEKFNVFTIKPRVVF